MDFLRLFSAHQKSEEMELSQTVLGLFALNLTSSWRVEKLVIERIPDLLSTQTQSLLNEIKSSLEKLGAQNNRILEISQILNECRKSGINKAFSPYDQPNDGYQQFLSLVYPEFKKGAPQYIPPDIEPSIFLGRIYYDLYEMFNEQVGADTKYLILENCIDLYKTAINHKDFSQVGETIKLGIYDGCSLSLINHYYLSRIEDHLMTCFSFCVQ